MISTVSGHYHTDLYIDWMFGKTRRIFAFAVGCGIDSKSYAMGYMQGGKKEAIACGVVLDNGRTPISIPMELYPREHIERCYYKPLLHNSSLEFLIHL